MSLKPEGSIMASLAVGAIVLAVYSHSNPSIADIRTAQPGNEDIQASNKQAAYLSAGVVAGVALIAKDMNIFILGGAMVIALSWYTDHANLVKPEIGKAVGQFTNPGSATDAQAQQDATDFSYPASA